MMQWISLIAVVVGLLLYFLVPSAKWQRVGEILLFTGLLALLMHLPGPKV